MTRSNGRIMSKLYFQCVTSAYNFNAQIFDSANNVFNNYNVQMRILSELII